MFKIGDKVRFKLSPLQDSRFGRTDGVILLTETKIGGQIQHQILWYGVDFHNFASFKKEYSVEYWPEESIELYWIEEEIIFLVMA